MPHNSLSPIFLSDLPDYCIGRIDEKCPICFRCEKKAEHMSKHLRRFRLDGGFRPFWKYYQADATVTPSQSLTCSKNGRRKMDSRSTVRSYPTYTENSMGKSMLEYLRTDSVPTLNLKQSFSTLRRFKRRDFS
ncbi:hypothetical protein LOAG_13715 [Loa loa]|uniref:Uncharacterized protein n=1 Tax=Loa loa TaxID=7209 RepID=A0A1S0TJ12_LOALO|nr:hypothetical protein LOAG_13715 [Loa loa]EFO14800.1 hypothetical protein LOAG_13715 [Loa loa]